MVTAQRLSGDDDRLRCPVEGTLVRYDGHIWFVGIHDTWRTRLDAVTATAIHADPRNGRVHQGWEGPINLDPARWFETVEADTLDDDGLLRYSRLLDNWRAEVQHRLARQVSRPAPSITEGPDEEDDMAEAAAAPVKSLKERNAERLEALKAKKNEKTIAAKVAKAAAQPTGAAKEAKAPREKKEREIRECKCGCGGSTYAHFVPGHDAQFKGKLLKIEKGEAQPSEVLNDEVVASYKWIKRGKGKIPTTNYKGEPHTGYLAEPVTE